MSIVVPNHLFIILNTLNYAMRSTASDIIWQNKEAYQWTLLTFTCSKTTIETLEKGLKIYSKLTKLWCSTFNVDHILHLFLAIQ